MPIVSSTFTLEEHPQKDGRTWVIETHTDQLGVPHYVRYLDTAGDDHTAIMNARVPSINADLINTELSANLAEVIDADV